MIPNPPAQAPPGFQGPLHALSIGMWVLAAVLLLIGYAAHRLDPDRTWDGRWTMPAIGFGLLCAVGGGAVWWLAG